MAALFDHILVPLDFTPKNSSALSIALRLAKQNDSHVTLLHVIETIEYADDDEIADFYETLKVKARANLANVSDDFRAAKIPVTEEIALGNRARGIVSHAIQKEVDLLILSSHKVKPNDDPRSWVTLSHQVSILSQCPVMLVK